MNPCDGSGRCLQTCECYCFDPTTFANYPTCSCGHREHRGFCPTSCSYSCEPVSCVRCHKTAPVYQIRLGGDRICDTCKKTTVDSSVVSDILAVHVARQNVIVVPPPPPSSATPAERGRHLEELIHDAAQKISGITRTLRELDIRAHFGDTSLNGVDHMITLGSTHVLIQDKWKETTTQQEVSQFITCAERIQTRLTGGDRIYLVWASKKEPTSNSAKMLSERHVALVCCGVSLEALARCVILQVCECLSVSPINPLMAIESPVAPTPMEASHHAAILAPEPPTATIVATFDDTVEGKRDIDAMKQLIVSIRSGVLQRAETAMRLDGIADIYTLWSSAIPKNMEEWWNGSFSKVDFNAYLKTIKAICWPTSKKHLPFRNLCYYTKLRKISVDFAPLSNDYETRRKGLLAKKSAWAKGLSILKTTAEPISDAEFRGAVINTMDYIVAAPRDHVLAKRHADAMKYKAGTNGNSYDYETSRMLSSFHTHQCTPY